MTKKGRQSSQIDPLGGSRELVNLKEGGETRFVSEPNNVTACYVRYNTQTVTGDSRMEAGEPSVFLFPS
jgi:hypothetical protein